MCGGEGQESKFGDKIFQLALFKGSFNEIRGVYPSSKALLCISNNEKTSNPGCTKMCQR